MKTLFLEGFKIETDLDEQDVFCRMNPKDEMHEDEILIELKAILISHNIIEFIEQVGINEISCAKYFYDNCKGYKYRRLEPITWRATKKTLTISYTGAMGGGAWSAKIFLT